MIRPTRRFPAANNIPFRRLALQSAIATALLGGAYGRQSYAGTCVGTGPEFTCTDPADSTTDVTQILTATGLTVTTEAGFGIETTAGDGITLNGTDGLTFTDNNGSAITGNYDGIKARNAGAGALSITTTGVVTGNNNFDGINATNEDSNGTDLIIDTVDVVGDSNGISARNAGTGVLNISASGTVIGNTGTGIRVNTSFAEGGSGAGIIISAVNVTGGVSGISAVNTGASALSITTTGTVTGNSEEGIFANNSEKGTNLTINAADVMGGKDGIRAENEGTGALSITTTGTVTGNGDDGIYSYNGSYGTHLVIDSVAVTGGRSGIIAYNYGSGELSIAAASTVTGNDGDGIYAYNGGANLTINAVDVTGDEHGIETRNYGDGALSITTTGTLTGNGSDGILAINNGTDLSISAADVTGAGFGVNAQNNGTGTLIINTSGAVTGNGGIGIFAYNSNNSNNSSGLAVDAVEVTSSGSGIVATNNGAGALSITTTGAVTGNGGDGIYALNNGTALTVNAVDITGGGFGVNAINNGTGNLSITTTGVVAGNGGFGIYAFGGDSGSGLLIDAADVTSGGTGILADNRAGTLRITTSGAVAGNTDKGISAFNSGTNLTINAADVTGNTDGIFATNLGTGSLSITTTGAVTGNSGDGIFAYNNGGTDLTISAVDISGAEAGIMGNTAGIFAVNAGTDSLSITTTGAVTGNSGDGIFAYNSGTDLTISAVDVSGAKAGIVAANYGSRSLNIMTTGTVTGNSGDGISAYNGGTDLTISAVDVSGAEAGIAAAHYGGGSLNITTNGTVTGQDNGIAAFTNGADLNITTVGEVHAVNGNALLLAGLSPAAASSVFSSIAADGTTGSITNTGTLGADVEAAVLMEEGFSFSGTFTNEGAITGGSNGVAIDVSNNTAGMTFNQTAGITSGNILLGSGDDVFTFSGGTLDGDIIGQGTGQVIIDAGAGNRFDVHGIENVEDYIIRSGRAYQLSDFSTAVATTTVESDGILVFSSPINGAGALESNGTLEFVVDGINAGHLTQAGTVTLNDGSRITIDTGGAMPALGDIFKVISADSLVVNGGTLEIDSNRLLFDFVAQVDGNDLSVVTEVVDLDAVSGLGNASSFGGALTAFVSAGGNNGVVNVLAGLQRGNVAGFEQVADVFSPSVSGALVQGALAVNAASQRLINDRFAGAETHDNAETHDRAEANGLWLQGFGGSGEQDGDNEVAGFEADTTGVALGYDRVLGHWRLGAAFSSGETEADNDRFARDRIDIESTGFTVYAGYEQDRWFANGTLSLSSQDYTLRRSSLLPTEAAITGQTEGDLLGLGAGIGYRYTVHGIVLTPAFNLRYSSLDISGYREEGGLALAVDYDSVDTLDAELGVSATAKPYTFANQWQLMPTGRLALTQTLGDEESAEARFADQVFTQTGFDRDQSAVGVGLGAVFSHASGFRISLDYDGLLGGDYTHHMTSFSMRYDF